MSPISPVVSPVLPSNTLASVNDPIMRSKRVIPIIGRILSMLALANAYAKSARKAAPGRRPFRVTASFGSKDSGPKK